MKIRSVLSRGALCAAALVAYAGTARASISDPGLTITASNANGSGTYQVFLSNGTWSENHTTWEWTSDAAGYDIYDSVNFTELAHVSLMHCKMMADPQVIVNFDVTAMSLTTHITVTTGLLTFPAGINSGAMGRATAGVTVTDNDSDGASLTGHFGSNSAYRANYNGTIPAGSIFANLLPGTLSAPVDGSNSASDAVPAVGYAPIAGSVGSMQAKFDFDLSANDSASGTSFYEIIPAPATLVLGAAGLTVVGRRRRA